MVLTGFVNYGESFTHSSTLLRVISHVETASSYVFTPSRDASQTQTTSKTRRLSHRPPPRIILASSERPEGLVIPPEEEYKYDLVDKILQEEDYYKILGLTNRKCNEDEIRRAYIGRSKVCHPE